MRYSVKALQAAGAVVQISIDAPDAQEASRQASRQGLSVLAIRPERSLALLRARPRTRFSLELFSQELTSLLEAGLSLVEAIETLAEKERGKSAGAVLADLCTHLYRGESFSQAMTHLPEVFPQLYVATVRAAERTGDVKEALVRYLDYQSQIDRVRRKVASASIYPILLIVVGGLVSLFMMTYVVPKFSRVYEEVGGNLPFLTRLLVHWGSLLEAHAAETLLALAALFALAAYFLTRPSLKRWLLPRLLRLPAIGERMRTYELARFYRTLGMLLKSGMTLVTALEMAGSLLSEFLRGALERAAREVREGQSVSAAFERHGLTTPVSLRLLGVGERSGRMPQMVERIALFYEDDLARWIDWFMRLFEPILMALIGALIGAIVVLLYLPIFELAETIQ